MPTLVSYLETTDDGMWTGHNMQLRELTAELALEGACRAALKGDIEAVREWLARTDVDVNACNEMRDSVHHCRGARGGELDGV